MGLDMSLTRKEYVKDWDHTPEDKRKNVEVFMNGKKIDTKDLDYLEFTVIDWRKANHIHAWFVENVQNGEDDCGEYYLTEEHVKSLNKACKKVLDDNSLAEELLPTASGFFFGGVEYDEYYFESVLDTWNITSALIREMKSWNSVRTDLSYQASW